MRVVLLSLILLTTFVQANEDEIALLTVALETASAHRKVIIAKEKFVVVEKKDVGDGLKGFRPCRILDKDDFLKLERESRVFFGLLDSKSVLDTYFVFSQKKMKIRADGFVEIYVWKALRENVEALLIRVNPKTKKGFVVAEVGDLSGQ